MNLAEIWIEGLKRVEAPYIKQALDYFVFESTDPFPPTIGQFLSKATEFKREHLRKNPIIRNTWEITDES